VFAAGDGTGNAYVSRRQNGALTAFQVFASGLGDSETIAVVP
jgi:hypothetical protein